MRGSQAPCSAAGAAASAVGADQRTGRVGREHQAAAELFHHHHRLDGAEAHAAMRLGHGEAGEAELGELAVDVARASRPALTMRVPALEGVALVDPAGDGVAQHVGRR